VRRAPELRSASQPGLAMADALHIRCKLTTQIDVIVILDEESRHAEGG
jgi:hypothetical protein